MFTDIILHGPASYAQPAQISGLKKINLFYGLNGTGKSTLSRYLADRTSTEDKYPDCTAEGTDISEILVYNEDFIRDEFWNSAQQKGIFTLDKTNTAAVKAIEDAHSFIQQFSEKKAKFSQKLKDITQAQEGERSHLNNRLWESRKEYQNSSLAPCMKNFTGSKENFSDKILAAQPSEIKLEDMAEALIELGKDLTALSDSSTEAKALYKTLPNDVNIIEQNFLFSQKIVGLEDSYLTELVSKLSHSDWITTGITEYMDQTDDCPFCARPLDRELKEKITAFIDTTYQTKLDQIKGLQNDFQLAQSVLENDIKALQAADGGISFGNIFKNKLKQLEGILAKNSALIEKKIQNPSEPINLQSTEELLSELNAFILSENSNIEDFNRKLQRRETEIARIKEDFWDILRKKHNAEITPFEENRETNRKRYKEIQGNLQILEAALAKKREIIQKNQKKTRNIDHAIKNINAHLKSFGMEGFSIVKAAHSLQETGTIQFYKIQRDNPSGEENEFQTLSEGEKTLISFLYFVELCQGTNTDDKAIQTKDRVVVIDDPVSSLSFNLVFDIAILIKRIFLYKDAPYKQIFLLTHHLYFLHEFIGDKKINKASSIYRITKSGHSSIKPIDREEIKNNYQCYWQIVREVRSNQTLAAVLPNTMRNILEYYFSFVLAEDSLKSALEKLSKQNNNALFSAFHRYMDRESHFDATNITDLNEIEIEKFIQYFKEVFIASGHGDHYTNMMEEDDTPAENITALSQKTGT